MSHVKIIASTLLLFFSITTNAKAVCSLIEKNVDLRKYSFKCNGEIVNIQCQIKNKNVCTVDIKEKLKSMKFDISEDQFNSMKLFSASTLEKAECDASKKLCKVDKTVCEKYKAPFKAAKDYFQSSLHSKDRCNSVLGESVHDVGVFSANFVSDTDFSKESCGKASEEITSMIKSKISVFEHNVELPFENPQSLLNRCVQPSHGEVFKSHEEAVRLKGTALSKFKNIIQSKMTSSGWIKDFSCLEGMETFYEDGKLEIDKIMCVIVEESILELDDKNVTCKFGTGNSTDRFEDGRIASLSGAKSAKADTTPIEQKAMPEAMASQIGKPVGLAPALAKVDQIAPGSGLVGSESNYAAGAVRNTIPTVAALQAGQAFAPVYEKLSTMGKSVGSSSTSVRQGVIGSGSPARSGSSGIVTVTRKTPTGTNSDSSIYDIAGAVAVGTSATLAKTSAAVDTGSGKKSTADIKNGRQDEASPALSGPRSLGLNSGGSSSGGSRSPSNSDTSGSVDLGNSEATTIVQKRITQLNTPAQIDSFFKREAANIPNLRELLYSDSTSKILASKGIRVVNQSGDESGETVAKAKYLYRDDGSKFTPLKLAKKN